MNKELFIEWLKENGFVHSNIDGIWIKGYGTASLWDKTVTLLNRTEGAYVSNIRYDDPNLLVYVKLIFPGFITELRAESKKLPCYNVFEITYTELDTIDYEGTLCDDIYKRHKEFVKKIYVDEAPNDLQINLFIYRKLLAILKVESGTSAYSMDEFNMEDPTRDFTIWLNTSQGMNKNITQYYCEYGE